MFLKEAELVAGEVVAIDGAKVRASNSKKNNYSQKKIERHLSVYRRKDERVSGNLEANDKQEETEKINQIQEKIERLES
ncbi:MAG: hypothetical protein IPM26_16660 [Saprospiraceae bacterium]|nr:hypothetical protein [Saprospiraceae bacterium]